MISNTHKALANKCNVLFRNGLFALMLLWCQTPTSGLASRESTALFCSGWKTWAGLDNSVVQFDSHVKHFEYVLFRKAIGNLIATVTFIWSHNCWGPWKRGSILGCFAGASSSFTKATKDQRCLFSPSWINISLYIPSCFCSLWFFSFFFFRGILQIKD